MSEPAAVWQQAADCFEANLAQIGDGQWEAPTGCGEWTVRDLVDHAVFWQANLGSMLGADAKPEDGWDAVKAAIAHALTGPSALEGTVEAGPMQGMPKHQAIGFATADALIHAWDLARAIGVDDTLPAEAVAAVHMGMSQAPEEMIRNPQVFGPAVEISDDASPQQKLLAFSGREP